MDKQKKLPRPDVAATASIQLGNFMMGGSCHDDFQAFVRAPLSPPLALVPDRLGGCAHHVQEPFKRYAENQKILGTEKTASSDSSEAEPDTFKKDKTLLLPLPVLPSAGACTERKGHIGSAARNAEQIHQNT